jgi:hypothetical protein
MPFVSWLHQRSCSRFVSLTLSVALLGCSDGIVGVPPDGGSRAVDAMPGQEIDVTLGNVGPGEYQSPPSISSASVAYLGVDVVPPFNPGGPTQRFRFRAAGSGTAVIEFRRALGDSIIATVTDTIRVR